MEVGGSVGRILESFLSIIDFKKIWYVPEKNDKVELFYYKKKKKLDQARPAWSYQKVFTDFKYMAEVQRKLKKKK